MAEELKIWNGRASCCLKREDTIWAGVKPYAGATVYAAAYSRADLRRLIEEYCGSDPGDGEILNCWASGAWGIRISRGLWLRKEGPHASPIRLI